MKSDAAAPLKSKRFSMGMAGEMAVYRGDRDCLSTGLPCANMSKAS